MIKINGRNSFDDWLLLPISAQLPGAQALETSGAVMIACKRFKV